MTALRGDRYRADAKIRSTCSVVDVAGCATYRTPALSPGDAKWFSAHQFVVAQNLLVLQRAGRLASQPHDGMTVTEFSSRSLSSKKQQALLDELLAIDAAAFGAPWQLTQSSFLHACHTTTDHRVIIAHRTVPEGVTSRRSAIAQVLGFVIVGRGGVRSYLQRLAVHSQARRSGVAHLLVHAAAHWANNRGASEMLVNTEPANVAALALYRKLGFVALPEPLIVMQRAVALPTNEDQTGTSTNRVVHP